MENPVILTVLAMVFSAIVLSAGGITFWLKGRRDAERARLRQRLNLPADDAEEDVLTSLLREQAADSALEKLGDLGERMQLTIQQAGLEMTVSTLVLYMVLAGFASLLGFGMLIGLKALPFALMIAYMPYSFVSRKAAARAQKLLAQMPDALEMMGRAMQTGAGLIDCFRLVQDEMPDPVGSEFGRVSDEVRFGKDWRLALEELIHRSPTLFELRLLVSSILLQRETGGNMIETVNRIAKLIRARYAFDAKVAAMTSEARASGFIVGMMPIAVLVLVGLANPEYLSPLWTTVGGQIVCVYAVSSYGMGIFIMQMASKVEV